MHHIVLCTDDDGTYHVATRTVFDDAGAAGLYAKTIAESRKPIAVPLVALRRALDELRFCEDRGTSKYWTSKGLKP